MIALACRLRNSAVIVVAGVSLALLATSPADAQSAQGVPNALQGFSKNRGKPIHIQARSLEVRDKDKLATFKGDVRVVQGDTNMRSNLLEVFYEPNRAGAPAARAAQPGPGGQSQIRRLVAKGNVIVTQAEQTATGDNGIYDMPSNTVTLLGNVVMTQGLNVVRGDKLIVDLTSGVSRVESGPGGGVRALIQSSTPQGGSRSPGGGASRQAPPAASSGPSAPRSILPN